MRDFRGTWIEDGDTIIYCGQGWNDRLIEARVLVTGIYDHKGREAIDVRPRRSSDGVQPTGRAVTLVLSRKIVVLRKRRGK